MVSATCFVTGDSGRYIGEVLKIWMNGESKEVMVTVIDDVNRTFSFSDELYVDIKASNKKKAQWKRKPVWIGG